MRNILLLFFACFAHFAISQTIYTELPPQHKGDTTALANRYDLSGVLLHCDSCYLDFRTLRKNVTECVESVTSTSSPVQLTSNCFDNFINQGGTQTSFVFKLPDEPVTGQICRLVFNNSVTSLGISYSDGTTLLTSTATSASVFTFKCYSGTWKLIHHL